MKEYRERDKKQPEKQPKKSLSLAKTALAFEGSAVAAALLIRLGAGVGFPFSVLFLSSIWVVVGAIAGTIMGIGAFFDKEKTKSDVVCAIIAAALPVLTVLILILLLSSGVIVIRFM